MRVMRALRLGLMVGLVALGACADVPTAPEPSAPTADLNLLGIELFESSTVGVVRRTTPLATDEVVTKVIGYSGGVIRLPRAGLRVVVPRGAVLRNTRITITAPAGDLLGYHFEPHGTRFRRPLRATQTLAGTEIGLLEGILDPPFAAYFEGGLLPEVQALEILDLNILGLLGVAHFQVPHFSGYVIATDGRRRAR